MPKLCQVIALTAGRKADTEKAVTEIYKIVQKPELFNGFERTYRALDAENGEKLPAERQKVQQSVQKLLEQATAKWRELWDLTATLDTGNQSAVADLVVDGVKIIERIPVTTLLFLDKQVNDFETFISKLPTPDMAEEWNWDANASLLRSRETESVRTKKEPAHYVKSAATKEHPAQVEYFHKDVGVGTWSKVTFSGAMRADDKAAILGRIKKLRDAIKVAREEANTIEVKTRNIGEAIFGFCLQ